MRQIFALALAFALALGPLTSRAEDDTENAEPWYKQYDFDLGLQATTQYDDNLYRWNSDGQADLFLTATPFGWFAYGERQAPFFARLLAHGSYRRYFGIDEVRTRRNVIDDGGHLELCIFGMVCLEDQFRRFEEPTPRTRDGLAGRYFNHAMARIRRGKPDATGWGRVHMRSGFLIDLHDHDSAYDQQSSVRETFMLDYLVHVGRQIRVGLLTDFDRIDWINADENPNYREPNAYPLDIRAQANVILAEHYTLGLEVGYGDTFRESGDSFRSAVGRLYFEINHEQCGELEFSVNRDFEVRPLWGYISDDSADLEYRWSGLDGRLGFVVGASYHYLTYGREPTADIAGVVSPIQQKQRFDNVVLAHAGIRGMLWKHLAASIDYQLEHDATGYEHRYVSVDHFGEWVETHPAEYTRHTISLSLILQWDATLSALDRFKPMMPLDGLPPLPDVPVYRAPGL